MVKINIGDKYGMLTVIEQLPDARKESGNLVHSYRCRCDCGNECIVTKERLLHGKQNCGCIRRRNDKNIKDLTGQRFGKLTVIKLLDERKLTKHGTQAQWLCQCDCGAEKIATTYLLKGGHTSSCGRCNKAIYDLTTYDYGVGTTNNGDTFIFDKEDYDKIKDLNIIKHHDYFTTSYYDEDGKRHEDYIHRIILGITESCFDDDVVVDHINHDKSDNRKCNLRKCNHSENNRNRLKGSNNTSGVVGVNWDSWKGKWHARISHNGRRISLGDYDNFDEAVAVRKVAEQEYYGEYSYDNSIKISTQV